MPSIIVHTLENEIVELVADEGDSVMEALTENDLDGIDAICGGSLSCATCHIHVAEPWINKLEAPSETEKELLCGVPGVVPTSRLSCQISMTSRLDKIEIAIPELP